jgi:hypothetical protein
LRPATSGALTKLDEHGRRFPRGYLDEEREALAIQALVNVQRYDDARARAAQHAATGLAAAWVYTQFAAFRLVTFFVAERPRKALLEAMKFRAEPKGANVWLVVPNDAGVFDGATTKTAIRCVHPVQAFLDLQGQPERAKEAAGELRSRMLR